jgi:hypothetical protein
MFVPEQAARDTLNTVPTKTSETKPLRELGLNLSCNIFRNCCHKFIIFPPVKLRIINFLACNYASAHKYIIVNAISIPCPFFVGRVKRQRNPTHLLGYGYGSYVATQAIATLWLTPPVRDT